ncbi:hypothetical protein G3I60_05090 [Streptomyces sp. SID13666]|uniref:hypothetical protein n=1 Tax=Streptomyces sp. SID13666 TaxID=2706054 RepID=UPI0013C1D999|nr:hypothetical protein [Streptomyces sp. SID13666]NEA53545.1 hypothetical protein [Streptomyces sp. SID13666]
MPADHSRKTAIRQFMAYTGGSYRQAAQAVDDAARATCCGEKTCDNLNCDYGYGYEDDPVRMCQHCLYFFGATADDFYAESCPNGCSGQTG